MGILAKAVAYKVIKNRTARRTAERVRAEVEADLEWSSAICTACGHTRGEHRPYRFALRCPKG